MSKFQLLTTMFENLRMNEDESIYDFNIRLRDIANTSLSLGKKMYMENLDRKIPRSLPKKFNMKVITIEKVQDLGRIKVDELISSLQTFEMTLNDISEKKKKGIAFMSNTEEYEDQSKESFSEAIALVGRKFNNSLNKLDRKWMTNVSDKVPDINPLNKSKNDYKPNKSKRA